MMMKFRIAAIVILCLALISPTFVSPPAASAQVGPGPYFVFLPAVSTTAQAIYLEKLPDLVMPRVTGISIGFENGRRVLRFAATVANIGDGVFEVLGSRPDVDTELMDATQRIYNSSGGYRDVPTTAQMIFAGDGHTHWHLKDLEVYELIQLDNNNIVTVGNKVGFCFFDGIEFDLSLPGAPQTPVYLGCGIPRSLEIVTGLSVGWSDKYFANLPGQDLDITGLPAGAYRIMLTSDPENWFVESNENNNATWVDIQILSSDGIDFTIIGYGPYAEPSQ